MNDNRRQLLKLFSLTGFASFLPGITLLAEEVGNDASDQGIIMRKKDQETFYIGKRKSPVTIMIDKKQSGVKPLSLCKEDIGVNAAIPLHKHLNEAELIFIQNGTGVFTLGEKEYEVSEGDASFVPKGVWHGLKNTGTVKLTMMFSYAPSGFEGYFREIGVSEGIQWKERTAKESASIDKKYGIVYKK